MVKLRQLLEKEFMPFLMVFLYMVGFGICYFVLFGYVVDDALFSGVKGSLFAWLFDRYHIWSSRLVIEAVMVPLLKLPRIIFVVFNALVSMQLVWAISKIFNREKSVLMNYCICGLFFVYPLIQMCSAGLVATTLNYLWPLSFMMVVMVVLSKVYYQEKISNGLLAYAIPSCLFACNHEQSSALMVGFFTLALLYFYYKKIPVDKKIYIFYLIALAEIVFILTCPGNSIRTAQEITAYNPEFESYSLAMKVTIGLLSTMGSLLTTNSKIVFLFACILAFAGTKNRNNPTRCITCLPLVMNVMMSSNIASLLGYGKFIDAIAALTFQQDVYALPTSTYVLGFVVAIVFIGAILMSLYLIFDDNYEYASFLAIIILAGLASRMIMGFSPTIYASGNRTFIFLYFALMIVAVLLLKRCPTKQVMQTLFILMPLSFVVTYVEYLIRLIAG